MDISYITPCKLIKTYLKTIFDILNNDMQFECVCVHAYEGTFGIGYVIIAYLYEAGFKLIFNDEKRVTLETL